MPKVDHSLWTAAIASTIAASVGWALWLGVARTDALVCAIALHLGGVILTTPYVAPGRRTLAVALALAVPAIGPLAAALGATVRGRGGRDLLHDPHAPHKRLDGSEIARALTQALPAAEAVVSKDSDTRRAALAKLSRRAGADDVAILRWARSQGSGDVAMEVALAFEEASERFYRRVSAARMAARNEATYEAAKNAFLVLLSGITSGIVDPPMVGKLAAEARRHHEAAVAREPARARELVASRARLELAVRRPQVALELLAPCLGDHDDAELLALYTEAAYAARRFDLAPAFAPRRAALARA